jgi:nitroimidazol reductase NimA-like FMN-containing flavoprotein (pyridoxamine 5'-phosphate oxidase superfamily)
MTMRTIDVRTGLEVLSETECLLLLGRSVVGRLATVRDGRPDVFPVNFRRDGRTIVFRTDAGTKLDQLGAAGVVAFEVDEIDPQSHTGWSVVVVGPAHDITDDEEPESLRRLRLEPWPPGPKTRYVRLEPERIDGRRIVRLTDAHYRRDP